MGKIPSIQPKEAYHNELKRILNNAPHRDSTLHEGARFPSDENALTQSTRFIAKAGDFGQDKREETFDAALGKVARHKPVSTP